MGIQIDRLSMDESVERAIALIREGGTHQHVVVNAAKVVSAQDNAELRAAINACSMINADGQSVVWASRLLKDPLPERVAGIDFMNALVDASSSANFSIFLLGAREEVVAKVSQSFLSRGATIAGFHNGYWRKEMSDADLAKIIKSSGANVLFVAIPSPQKEIFLAENLDRLGVNLAVGVGGSFDVVAGITKRAPVFLQKAGLEWLYRLAQEPRRMFKRYLVGNIKFTVLVLRELIEKGR
ncbi:WecB/TagA/CpsF family glycosyltransferase [Paenarthrobacter nicotinovorans]|uniref:WecB/TagA/CpsF family glycosyltransferase n=1 Tax=Paenarthrobacter nicotinovorans TaxID=29320 RepID=UPI00382E97AA